MQSTRHLFLWLLSLTIGFWSHSSSAQEWTRFRGPNGTGISTAETIPVTWTPADYNWKVKLPGSGHSSPVLWGDKIFLTGADHEKTGERLVFCVSAADGKTLWSRRYESRIHKRHELNSFASPTPAVDEDRVYVAWSTPEEYTFLALDHEGKDVWQRNLGPFASKHSSGASPIVFEDMVILSGDQESQEGEQKGESFVLAVDRKTGKDRWKLPRQAGVMAFSTPCIYQHSDGPVELILNTTVHGISAVNPRTGEVDWEVGKLFDKRSVSSPVVASAGTGGDLIFGTCGSGGGGNYLVAVHPGSAAQPDSGKQAYTVKNIAPYVPTPLVKGDLLFLWGDKGVVSCLRALTEEVLWQKRVGGDFFGSPICIGDKLYCISTAGEVVVLAASENYELLGRNPLDEVSHSTPAVAGGRLYLRTFSHLISVGGKK